LDIFLAGRTIGRAYPEKTTEKQPIQEEDSQFTIDTLKETIRKEMFLVVKMVSHVMKLTDGLETTNCESVTDSVGQTCHEVMELVDNIQSNLFSGKRKGDTDQVCALGKPDPSSGSIDKAKSAAEKLSTCLYQAFELEGISTENSVEMEMVRTKLILSNDNLEKAISEVVNEVIVPFI